MNIEENKRKVLLPPNGIQIQLKAFIDPIGRSIKPLQIKHWLEECLGHPIEISRVQRDEIQLLEC